MKSYFHASIIATSWMAIALAVLVTTVFSNMILTTAANSVLTISKFNTNFIQFITPSESHELLSESRQPVNKGDLTCMAKNIYYEARGESYLGKMAVGQVTLNRLHNVAYPATVCGVVNEKSKDTATCAFSWVCDDSKPMIELDSDAWRDSQEIAYSLLAMKAHVIDITEGATYYHAYYVKPAWTKQLRHVVTIDDHLFYAQK